MEMTSAMDRSLELAKNMTFPRVIQVCESEIRTQRTKISESEGGQPGNWEQRSRRVVTLIHAIGNDRGNVVEQMIDVEFTIEQFLHFKSTEAGSGSGFLQ